MAVKLKLDFIRVLFLPFAVVNRFLVEQAGRPTS